MIQQALFAHLSTDPAVAPLVAGAGGRVRIFPLVIPQRQFDEQQLDCMVYSVSDTQRDVSYCGTQRLVRSVIDIDCYSQAYDTARALAAAVRGALADYSGLMGGVADVRTANITSEADLLDIEPGIYRVAQTWSIWHVET